MSLRLKGWALLACLLLLPGPAAAVHFMDDGNACYGCHNLNANFAEPDTSLLDSAARNMAQIKAAWAAAGRPNGRDVPDEFGCVYCHSSPVMKDDPLTEAVEAEYRMRDVSNHFRNRASRHPVGIDLATGRDTKGHLLSTFDCLDNSTGGRRDPLCEGPPADGLGDRRGELDCVDCHDLGGSGGYLGYPNHGAPPGDNPFMLRDPLGNSDLAAGEYDDACRRCHGSATGAGGTAAFKGTGVDLRLSSFRGGAAVHKDGSDAGANAMTESDGTVLKTADPDGDGVPDAGLAAQCSACHEAHYSSRNSKLFAAAIDTTSDCTTLCHYRGDAAGNFDLNGHGSADRIQPFPLDCDGCHSVNSDHESPSGRANMLSNTADPNLSSYGTSRLSLCWSCHRGLAVHGGGESSAGCLDCHDEHAEGVSAGANSGTNLFMVPQRLPNNHPSAEAALFESAGDTLPGVWDYYVSNSDARRDRAPFSGAKDAGLCDNGVCHEGLAAAGGTPSFPLRTLMTGARHGGGDQTPGSDCGECHRHDDPEGSWRASPPSR